MFTLFHRLPSYCAVSYSEESFGIFLKNVGRLSHAEHKKPAIPPAGDTIWIAEDEHCFQFISWP